MLSRPEEAMALATKKDPAGLYILASGLVIGADLKS